MADEEKKKLSVAEILAAARKTDSAKTGGPTPEKNAPPPAAREPAGEKSAPEEAAPASPAEKEPVKKPSTGGARPSVAEMMAMARGEKGGGAKPAAEKKPVEKKPVEKKPAAAKPAPPAGAPAKAAAKAPPSGPKDTASILAAARQSKKPGPITKAEAAALGGGAAATATQARPAAAPTVPPMPSKPRYAQPKPAQAEKAPTTERRRFVVMVMIMGSFLALGFSSLAATLGLWTLGMARFMFPNILREPPSQFKVGFPSDFAPGTVDEKFKSQFGVWVVNSEYDGQPQIYALKSVCTHLGCTPNWLEAEQKFKCPCHGSGFYKDGINFEGPAPRPLERYAVRIADDGQLEIDRSRTFQQEMGGWDDPASYITV